MNDVVIRATKLKKVYRLYSKPSYRFRDIFELLGDTPGAYTEHAALDGVNIEIGQGEKVAIIGRNGAGKSTFLKLVTNVIQGQQVDRRCADVIEFAELEEYIDQPMKSYSTGMTVRLMFSASTAITPDLLVLDEVLGVGDAYFAHKSYEVDVAHALVSAVRVEAEVVQHRALDVPRVGDADREHAVRRQRVARVPQRLTRIERVLERLPHRHQIEAAPERVRPELFGMPERDPQLRPAGVTELDGFFEPFDAARIEAELRRDLERAARVGAHVEQPGAGERHAVVANEGEVASEPGAVCFDGGCRDRAFHLRAQILARVGQLREVLIPDRQRDDVRDVHHAAALADVIAVTVLRGEPRRALVTSAQGARPRLTASEKRVAPLGPNAREPDVRRQVLDRQFDPRGTGLGPDVAARRNRPGKRRQAVGEPLEHRHAAIVAPPRTHLDVTRYVKVAGKQNQ